ncbi:hypothetical protein ACHAXT_001861 [Thalassiosira profunda]
MASAQLRMARRGGRRSPLPQAPEVDAVEYEYDELWSDAEEADKMSDGEEEGFKRAVMASLSKAGSGIPFTKEHLRNPTQENSKVHQSARKLLDAALAEPLVNRNELLMPGASIGRKLNMRFLSMGNCIHGGTYHLSNGKDGRSVHMQNRKEDPKYKDVEGTVAFNHSMASSEALDIIDQTFVQLKELDGVKMEEVDLREMDISQAAQSEKEEGNLAFIPRAVIHSMKSDVDDVIGGADRAQGVYNAFMLNCIETAQAELYARREVPGVSSPEALAARQDEHLHFNGMPWVTDADRLANTELLDLFKKLEEYFSADWLKEHDFTDLSSLEVQREPLATEDEGDSAPGEDVVVTFKDGSILVVDSSWAPKLGHPDVAATVLFYDNVVFNVPDSKGEELWRDTFTDECEPIKGDLYNSKDGFTAPQRERARLIRRLRLRRLKARGGIGIFDVCNEAYRDVRYNFLDELEKEGFGKHPIFQFLNCSFYCMEKDGVKTLALVHDPPCTMLQSSTERRIKWHELKSQAYAAQTNHFIQGFVRNLGNAGNDKAIETNQRVMQNCLMAFCARVYILCNLHCHSLVASLVGKNFLDGHRNVFAEGYHDLRASGRGRNLREQLRKGRVVRGEQEKDATKPNKWIHHNIMFLMLRHSFNKLEVGDIVDRALEFVTDRQSEMRGDTDNRKDRIACFVDECVEDDGLKQLIWGKFNAMIASEDGEKNQGLKRKKEDEEEEKLKSASARFSAFAARAGPPAGSPIESSSDESEPEEGKKSG